MTLAIVVSVSKDLSITDHWFCEARRVPSPNCNQRPDSCEPELLVIHNISLPPGQFGGGFIEQLFSNQLCPDEHPYFAEIAELEVSSHLLIDRQGGLTQFVGFDRRAWHAGVSCYLGREACNDFSIGIELEGTDELPYTDAQYQQLVRVIERLIESYPSLSAEHIVGHSDISPGRKTDPGPAFDWERLKALLKSRKE